MSIKNIFVLLFLIFLPTVLIEISYLLFVGITYSFGLPNLNALSLSVLLVMLPLMITIILIYSKKELGYKSLNKMILYRKTLEPKKFAIYSIILIFIIAAVFVTTKSLSNFIQQNFFSFVPQKYVLAVEPENHTKTQLWITLFSVVFVTGMIAPVVEEIYFRGFLLPRMEWMGILAPILNAFLFSLYHFWSPWLFVSRTLFLIPFCYIIYKTKNIKLGIFVHCLVNVLGDGIGVLLIIINELK